MRPGFMHRMRREGSDSHWLSIDRAVLKHFASYLAPHKSLVFLSSLLLCLNSLCSLIAPLITKQIIDGHLLQKQKLVFDLSTLAGFLVLVAFLLWLLDFLRQKLSVHLGQKMVTTLRCDLLSKVFTQPPKYLQTKGTGNLVSIIIGDVDELSQFASTGITNIVGDSLILIGGIVLMFFLNPYLALAVVPVFPLLIFGLIFLGRLFRAAAKEERVAAAAVVSGAEEGVSGVRVVQSVTGEKRHSKRFAGLSKKASKAKVKSSAFFATILPLLSVAGALATAITLVAGKHLYTEEHVSVGVIVAFLWYIRILFGPLRELSLVSQVLAGSAASLERIWPILTDEPEVQYLANGVETKTEGPLSIDKLSFSYGEGEVLTDLSFSIGAGEKLIIAGTSGSGKSTLVYCLARLLSPKNGEIKIGELKIKELSRQGLRHSVLLSPQEVFLFPGTVAENILLAKAETTREQLEGALEDGGLKEFITSLPNGLDTTVGEGGLLLSGGQKRLVALARIALSSAPIVLLDEPLAGVDPITFSIVRQSLTKVLAQRTAIITTHRLDEFVEDEDLVLCLHDGKNTGLGKHKELLQSCPHYKKLVAEN